MEILNKLLKLQDNKSKTVFRNVFFSFFIKGINIAVNFLTIPLVLTFLNTTQYGVWLTLTAILGWFALFDLGFGNGLRNHLTVAVAKQDFKEGKIYVSTTYAALSVIFGSLIVIFLVIHPYINWVSVFNAPQSMAGDINYAVMFAICFLFVQFVVRLINTVLLSFQRAAMADFTNSLVQVCVLLGLYLVKILHISSLASVAIVYSAVPVIVFLTVSFILFYKKYAALSPSFYAIKFTHVKSLLNLGLNFFVIQIAALILYASDNFIIAQLFAPAQVTVYNIAFKYFSIVSILFTIVLSPFWSMTTQALVEGDWNWIKSSIKKLQYLWAGLLICGVIQFAVANPIYKLWTLGKVIVPLQLSGLMFVYFMVTNWSSIYSNFLNGVGKVKLQLYCGVGGMIFNIPFAIYLAKTCHMGIVGIPMATICTMLIANVIGVIQYNKIVNGTAVGIWNK